MVGDWSAERRFLRNLKICQYDKILFLFYYEVAIVMFNNVHYCVFVLLCLYRLCLYLEQTLEFRLKYFSMCRLF